MSDEQATAAAPSKLPVSPRQMHDLIQSIWEGAEWSCNTIFDAAQVLAKAGDNDEELIDAWTAVEARAMLAKITIRGLINSLEKDFRAARDIEAKRKARELDELLHIA